MPASGSSFPLADLAATDRLFVGVEQALELGDEGLGRTPESNKAVMRRWIEEGHNGGNLKLLDKTRVRIVRTWRTARPRISRNCASSNSDSTANVRIFTSPDEWWARAIA